MCRLALIRPFWPFTLLSPSNLWLTLCFVLIQKSTWENQVCNSVSIPEIFSEKCNRSVKDANHSDTGNQSVALAQSYDHVTLVASLWWASHATLSSLVR